jgi:hypothetical protein
MTVDSPGTAPSPESARRRQASGKALVATRPAGYLAQAIQARRLSSDRLAAGIACEQHAAHDGQGLRLAT